MTLHDPGLRGIHRRVLLVACVCTAGSGCDAPREADAERPTAVVHFDETSEDTVAARLAATGPAATELAVDAPGADAGGEGRGTPREVAVPDAEPPRPDPTRSDAARQDVPGPEAPPAPPGAAQDPPQAVTTFTGSRVPVRCAPNFPVREAFGTDLYASTSHVCTAAVHAGAVDHAEGGAVEIEILPGQEIYTGSERNGVVTRDHGRAPRSFRVH